MKSLVKTYLMICKRIPGTMQDLHKMNALKKMHIVVYETTAFLNVVSDQGRKKMKY